SFSMINNDLTDSKEIVNTLSVPESTETFVFAIKVPEQDSTIYILSAQNLSLRSVIGAEYLIRELRPDAVVAQLNAIRKALDSATKMLSDVNRGESIDKEAHLSEVYLFRIAVEGIRIALNKSGCLPIWNLVVDAGNLAGLRRHWRTYVPQEVKDMSTKHTSNTQEAMSMVKPSLSAEIIRGVTQCLLSSARETSLSSVQATLYMMIMRRRAKPVGTLPLTMFGASLATFAGLVFYEKGMVCAGAD
ncbi:hypothetical protein DY000_02002384, partial [Brassica cretica]